MGSAMTEDVSTAYVAARRHARMPYDARVAKERYRNAGIPPDSPPPMPDAAFLATHLAGIPLEFRLYLRGTEAYYRQDYAQAISRWSRILSLPEPERRYRSTWAAFMIGKAYIHVDPRSAVAFFEMTRELAEAGFPDPLTLARASDGWEAKAELRLGKHYESACLYAKDGDGDSLGRVMRQALALATMDPRFVTDSTMRPLTLAVLEDGRFDPETTHRIYQTAFDVAPDDVGSLPGRLAHRMYRDGNFQAASDWVELSPAGDPNGRWVRSKLLLREGKIDEAMDILRGLVQEFPTFTARVPVEDDMVRREINLFYADLGVLSLGRGAFVESLDMLVRSGFFVDAAYVAEAVLTPEELHTYLVEHAKDPVLRERKTVRTGESSDWEQLSYIYARRLARDAEWSNAIDFYPENVLTVSSRNAGEPEGESVADVATRVAGLTRTKGTKDERASALMQAAFDIRKHGLALMGTECAPDWAFTGGRLSRYLDRYDRDIPRIASPGKALRISRPYRPDLAPSPWDKVADETINALMATDKEVARYAQSRPKPDKLFHFRYRASEVMWNAAALLPNNDPRTAQALWYGGSWLENDDPQAADRFYKALVRRCWKLPIGREADALRWFPPMPEEWRQLEGTH
jgi:tetratricopeptide (TPR) repeat protein